MYAFLDKPPGNFESVVWWEGAPLDTGNPDVHWIPMNHGYRCDFAGSAQGTLSSEERRISCVTNHCLRSSLK